MWHSASLLIFALVTAEVDPAVKPGVEFRYQGTVAKVERDRSAQAATKSFDLAVWVAADDAEGTDFLWLLDERGQGAFGWTDRFGKWSQTADGAASDIAGPALLYDYGKGKHVVPLAPPRFPVAAQADAKVAAGTKWTRDGREHEVLRAESVDGRAAWLIEVRNQFGVQKRVWVDQATEVVLQEEDRVFMDQGTEYRVALRLGDVEMLTPEEAAARRSSFAALEGLRNKLKRTPRAADAKLTPAQLKLLAAELPAAKKAVSAEAARLLDAAERDLKQQSGRTTALDAVVRAQLGREVGRFEVDGLDGEKLKSDDLRGAITVLHFWDYRDEPLKEPYGQVGYLEFLYDKRKADGVNVVGVAVDTRFQQPAAAKQAITGVRKFKNFMNLTYPIVFDSGELIREFGDPRLQGGELPLFVVVGPSGKISHYKIGTYVVDREAGLKQLDAAIAKLLEAKAGQSSAGDEKPGTAQ